MHKKYTIFSVIIFVAILAGFFAMTKKPAQTPAVTPSTPPVSVVQNIGATKKETPATPPSTQITEKDSVAKPTLSVSPDTTTIKLIVGDATTSLSAPTNSSLYQMLKIAQMQGQITFSGKQYSGLGFFVTAIGGLQSGGGKNLLYYINGKEASVGVSTYIPQNGDVVEWKLE